MLKPIDLYVLIGLLAATPDPDWTQAVLAAKLGIPQPAMTRALQRLGQAGLWDRAERRADTSGAEEILVHAARFLVPPRLGPVVRGLPTAYGAPPLADAFVALLPLVWPDDDGTATGPSLAPIHPAAPAAARRDGRLYELLALVDALRVGRVRERSLAAAALRDRIRP